VENHTVRLLIIENNSDDVVLLQQKLRLIKDVCYVLDTAETLAEGLEKVQNHPYDIMILDLGLPDSLGIETLKKVKKQARHLPVIVSTGNSEESIVYQCIANGAQDCLIKDNIQSEVLSRSIRYAIERNRLLVELEMKNTALGHYDYTISHDLKNPLITIIGLAKWAQTYLQERDWPRCQKDIREIELVGNEMIKMLEHLLEVARFKRSTRHFEMVPMNTIISAALRLCAGDIQKRQVQVEVEEGMPEIYCDELQMRQVMENIISNGVKHIGDQSKPHIAIGCRREMGNCIFWVRDNGKGLTPEQCQEIFALFIKHNPQSEDAGVDLAMVCRIVEAHWGKVWAESPGLNQGSTFYVSLPCTVHG